MRAVLAVLVLVLSGCAHFDAPRLVDVLADQQRCSDAWVCRTLIEDRPVPLVSAVRPDPHDTHRALCSLGIDGRIDGAFVLVQWQGREYALGHSWACPGVCKPSEARQ